MARVGGKIDRLCDCDAGTEHGSDAGNEPDLEACGIDEGPLREEQEDDGMTVIGEMVTTNASGSISPTTTFTDCPLEFVRGAPNRERTSWGRSRRSKRHVP
jgi:hypothetical protein